MRQIMLAMLSLMCWPTLAFAFTADKRDTLRGLSEVSVLVEYLPDDIEREGLDREQLKRDIEGRLREAGLRILSITEIAKSPGAPYVYVAVYGITGPTVNGTAYAVVFTLRQLVQLSRNPTIELFATTWEGSARPSSLSAPRVLDVRNRITDAVERFLIDYQAVNLK